MGTTPSYTKKAIADYQKKFDRIHINFEKGTKERVNAITDESLTSMVNRLVKAELERLEKEGK